jgi:hypothetical protein
MPVSNRRHRITIRRRSRSKDSRHGYMFSFTEVDTVWGSISPTLGGGRRERQVFGPRVEFEMNAMGVFHPYTDVRVTDRVKVRDDEYEVLAVVNSLYKDSAKFAALKTIIELDPDPIGVQS